MNIPIPVLEVQPPDSTKLVERMLKPHNIIELAPFGLVDGGRSVALMPARRNKLLDGDDPTYVDVDRSTLPTIDLKKAGIGTDRRPGAILADVEKLLDGRRFIITPTDSFPFTLAVGQVVGIATSIKEAKLTIQGSHWLFQPSGFDPRHEMDEMYNSFPQFGFRIALAEGEPIEGLDLSKPLMGFVWAINRFLLPFEKVDQASPEYAALKAIVGFYLRQFDFLGVERSLKSYLDKNQQKWWFIFFQGRTRRWIERRDRCLEEMNQARATANTRLAALSP